jgi:hypothetical protein
MCDIHPDFYTVTTPTARKPHRCCECLRTIEIGERYERVSAKYDGRLADIKTCGDCSAIIASLQTDCYVHSELRGYLSEIPLARQTDAMKAFRLRREWNYQQITNAKKCKEPAQ